MQVETAQKHLHRFFFHNCVALQLIEDPDLVAAFKAVGVPLVSRKVLSTTELDREYERVKAKVRLVPLPLVVPG